jgi:5-methylcytosine-specific restriction endonuclease McrA
VVAKKNDRLNQVVSDARRASDARERGYREQALKMYPHICGRCAREFDTANLHELTVHHRDHDHDNNPEDGSNWELLCIYCHDNEHQRQLEAQQNPTSAEAIKSPTATYNPFSNLKSMLENNETD